MSIVKNITDEQFVEEVLNSELPVLVDFWAPWCGPCKSVLPVLDQLATQKSEQLKVVKLNVDDWSEAAQAYGVLSIPTLILIKDKKEVTRLVGAKTLPQLLDVINHHL